MFDVDGDWIDFSKRKPPKTGEYWVICGDNCQRKAKWNRVHCGVSKWSREGGFPIPNTWKGILAWKPIDPTNPNDE